MSWSSLATLYGIQSGELIKVGIAVDVRRRIEQFRLYNPHPLKVVIRRSIFARYIRRVEIRTHQLLAAHARGREWFACPVAEIKVAIAVALAENEARDLAIRMADAEARLAREATQIAMEQIP